MHSTLQEARLEPPVEVDKKVNPEGDEELGMVRVETAQSSSTQIRFDRARSRSQSLDAKDGEDEPVRGKKQVIFAPEVAGEARSTSVGSAGHFAFPRLCNFMEQLSLFKGAAK
eukprot:g10682.t1